MPYHSETVKRVTGALGVGGGVAGAADMAEGNGLDRARAALDEVGGAVSDLVAAVTPDFISDFVSGIVEAARSGGDVAGEAAGGAMGAVVPHVADLLAVVM